MDKEKALQNIKDLLKEIDSRKKILRKDSTNMRKANSKLVLFGKKH